MSRQPSAVSPRPRKLTPVQQRKLRTLQCAWDALYDVQRQFRGTRGAADWVIELRAACAHAQLAINVVENKIGPVLRHTEGPALSEVEGRAA